MIVQLYTVHGIRVADSAHQAGILQSVSGGYYLPPTAGKGGSKLIAQARGEGEEGEDQD